MPKNAGEMVKRRPKRDRGVISRVKQPLHGPVEVGSRRIDEEVVIESFRDQSPAADQWITQDQSGIVPDNPVAQGGGVNRRNNEDQEQGRRYFFHQDKNRLDKVIRVRV